MQIDILLVIVIIVLIIYIAYMQKLHYDERKGLYRKIGIEIDIKKEDNVQTSKVKNHIKKRMMEIEQRQGGE